jgi:hypothetical protein
VQHQHPAGGSQKSELVGEHSYRGVDGGRFAATVDGAGRGGGGGGRRDGDFAHEGMAAALSRKKTFASNTSLKSIDVGK